MDKRRSKQKTLIILGVMAYAALTTGCPVNALPTDAASGSTTSAGSGNTGGSGSGGGSGTVTYTTIRGTNTTSTTVDAVGNNLLANNSIRAVFPYNRANDSSSSNMLLAGIDPNWYNGITRQRGMLAFSATNANENYTASGMSPVNGFWTASTLTVEFWFKLNAIDAATRYFHHVTDGAGTAVVLTYITAAGNPGCQLRRSNNTNVTITGATTLTANRWYHFACVYDQNDLKLFIDGASDAAPVASVLGLLPGTPGGVYRINHGTAASAINGQMSEIRHSNIARYSANFTPARRFESDGNTTLLIHGDDGPANTTLYNAALDTVGQRNGGYFSDGSATNYFKVSHSSALTPPGRFTIETWVWFTQYPNVALQYLLYKAGMYAISVTNTGAMRLTSWGGAPNIILSGAGTVPLNQWTHLAASFDGTNTRLFVNGNLMTTVNTSAMTFTGVTDLIMGYGGPTAYYMDEVRVVHDAIYTANFTPRRRYQEVPNTAVMYHLDETSGSTATDSSGNGFHATLNSTTAHSARFLPLSPVSGGSVPPAGAFYSANTSGLVTVANSASINNPGGASLTVEAWAYKLPNATIQYVISKGDAYGLYLTAANNVAFRIFDGALWQNCISASTISDSTWAHLAGTYDVGTGNMRVWINGTLDQTCAVAGNVATGNNPLYISGRATATNIFGGYIDEVRVAWDVLYTANFTPSRVAATHTADAVRLHFNEAPGSMTAYDASGNGNNGALQAANSEIVLLNDIPLTLTAGAGTPRIFPTSPLVTTGCENITHTGGLDDDSAIELWITRGGTTGVARYQWRKVGGNAWSNAFNSINLQTSAASTPLGATGVHVAFAANANFATDDHCVIRSWAIENGASEGLLNSTRGTANAFPSRANIIATDSGIDIIDTSSEPYTVWMRINHVGSSTGPMQTANVANAIIRDLHFLNGRLYVAVEDVASTTSGGHFTLDFGRDRSDSFLNTNPLSRQWGTTTAPRALASRHVADGDVWTATGAYANGSGGADVSTRRTYSTSALNVNGRQWVAFSPGTRLQLLDEFNQVFYFIRNGANDFMPFATLVPNASGTGIDAVYYNSTQGYVGVKENIQTLTGSINGVNSYTRQYSIGATPGIPTGAVRGIATTTGTSTAVTGYNTLYVAHDSGVSIIHEGATTGAGAARNFVLNPSRWPWNAGGHMNFSAVDNVVVNHDASFGLTSNLTVEARFRTSTTSTWKNIASYYDWSGNRGYFLTIHSGNYLCFYVGVTAYCGPTVVTDGQWHHVAAVLSGTTLRIYLDGRLERFHTGITLANLVTSDSPALCIGGRASAGNACANGNPFVGDLDEIRISSTARYSGSAPGVPSEPFTADANTVALLHFDEGAGAIAYAANGSSTTAFAGNITGATWQNYTHPSYDFDLAVSTGNNVVAVSPSTDGSSLFVAVNNTENDRSAVMRIADPSGAAPAAAETITTTTGPSIVSDRISALACTNDEPDVLVGTAAGYTVLNYTPF